MPGVASLAARRAVLLACMALPAWIAASAPVNAIMRPSPVVLTTHSPELLRDPAQDGEATVRVRLLVA